jgi:hypothetical protein
MLLRINIGCGAIYEVGNNGDQFDSFNKWVFILFLIPNATIIPTSLN